MRNRVVIYDSERQAVLRKRQLYWISQKVSSFFWDSSPDRPDFESREGQQDMAFEIMDAIIAGRHILVEAGVGIGKSYAYLVPLLLCSDILRKPVVAATSTIALQEQLLGDVKYLQKQLGLQQEIVLAKGQTHYLCRKRAESYLSSPDAVQADELRFLIAQGFQDRTDFPGDFPQSLWKNINIVRFSSTGFPFNGDGVLAEPKPSPFPYDTHSMIYYCDDLPHPTKEHEAFVRQGVERLIEILDISQGKALVLFTAKTDLEEAFAILRKKELPYKILTQQPGASQNQVLKEFREDENSVLLGTGAYWEGIDIRGKSLSNLVIFRLPFPVPDPIIEYKASLAKNQLMEVRVPEMIIKLKQGIGRLIRGFSDTGIVSIIDPRLRDKPASPYRDITWASLPIHNRTTSLDELREFYHALDAGRE